MSLCTHSTTDKRLEDSNILVAYLCLFTKRFSILPKIRLRTKTFHSKLFLMRFLYIEYKFLLCFTSLPKRSLILILYMRRPVTATRFNSIMHRSYRLYERLCFFFIFFLYNVLCLRVSNK